MRNWTRILLVLFTAALANLAPAQNKLVATRVGGITSMQVASSPSANQRQLQPGQQAPTGASAWAPSLGSHYPPSPLLTTACGPDTLLYPLLAKTTGLRILTFNDSVATGQWYPAPQPITVRGASFYAWVDSATSATVTLLVRIYNAGLDSLPTGAPLSTASITIDSSFSPGTLAFLEKSVAFPAPVVVTAPYVITVENNTPIACGTVTNNFSAGDGLQEWLGHIYLPGAPTAWYHGYDIQINPTTVFDADNLIYPHVTYNITAAYTANPLTGCAPLNANFTNTSSPVMFSRFYNTAVAIGNPDSSFNWNYGNATPIQQIINGSTTYPTVGTYNVTLRDSMFGWRYRSCVDIANGVVNVVNAPTAAFTTSLSGSVATFTNTSVAATSYSWNFGDGSPTSSLTNPTHTYATPGTYNVCLTATGSCGSVTTCQSVVAGCPPLFAAFVDSVQGLSYGVADVSTGSAVTSWLWDFGDGTTATTPQATHIYAVAGVYTVCLTVGNGCSFDSTCMVVVIGCPIPIANWGFVTSGQTVNFTDLSTNLPAAWAWNFGDGSPISTSQNPTHTYTNPGPFTVCLIVGSTCGADTLCQTVISGCNTPIANFNSTTSNLTATFTDLSTNAPTTWAWTFGDGNTSSLQSPNHTYTAPGTYNVCLTASSSCGTTTFCSTVIVTCPAPVVNFTSSVTGLTANFTNTSINATSFSWAFGDGGTSSLQNPSHIYAQGGTYQVCLTATSACGSTTQCSTVVLNCPTPASNFSFTNINLNYSFTSLSTGSPTSYAWTFGDGGTSTLQNPTHLYANVGTFQVCLITTNACGADTFCVPVTVTCQPPTAAFTNSASNLTVTFANTSTGNPTTYQWNFGDGSGTSIQTNPTYTYATPGTYQVCLTAVNNCGSANICISVTVGCAAPTANFNFLTIGNTANFSNLSSPNATTYAWNFGDGNSSTLQNPSHSYNAIGTYNVCLISSSVCGADTFCRQVIVTCVPPAANFAFVVSNDSVASFTNQASPNSTSWIWNFGDGSPVTSTANPVHIYQAPGTYTVCLEVINTCGRDTICRNVTITCVNPTSGYTTQVTNAVANFISLSLGAQTYFWDFGDGTTSTLQNPSHAYTASGIFTACLTVTNFCGSNTSCQNLVIACNAPTPSFSAVNGVSSVNFIDQSVNFPTRWFWTFGDNGSDTVQNPNHVFLYPGQFYVCLTAINSCGSNFVCQWVTVTAVNVPEATQLDRTFNVYPNPSDGRFTMDLELPRTMDIRVRVLNMLGQEVKRQPTVRAFGNYSESLDLSDLASGTYHLELTAGEAVLHRALVKR
jgi:PKD repeat protein